jgi:hypothetical protein
MKSLLLFNVSNNFLKPPNSQKQGGQLPNQKFTKTISSDKFTLQKLLPSFLVKINIKK